MSTEKIYSVEEIVKPLGFHGLQSVTKAIVRKNYVIVLDENNAKSLRESEFISLLVGFYKWHKAPVERKEAIIHLFDVHGFAKSLLDPNFGDSVSDTAKTLSDDRVESLVQPDGQSAEAKNKFLKSSHDVQPYSQSQQLAKAKPISQAIQPKPTISQSQANKPSHTAKELAMNEAKPSAIQPSHKPRSGQVVNFFKRLPSVKEFFEHDYFLLFLIHIAILGQCFLASLMGKDIVEGNVMASQIFCFLAVFALEEMALVIAIRTAGSMVSNMILLGFFALGVIVGKDFHAIGNWADLLTFKGVLAVGLPFIIMVSSHAYLHGFKKKAKIVEEREDIKAAILKVFALDEARENNDEKAAEQVITDLFALLPNRNDYKANSSLKKQLRTVCIEYCQYNVTLKELQSQIATIFLNNNLH